MAVPNRTTIYLSVIFILCASAVGGAQPPRPASPSPAASPTPASTVPTQPSAETSSQASRVAEDEADLAITANVTAESLKFDAVPNVTVEFPGRPRRETAWEAERTNLPRPVQPGVTYRDVGVRLKIVSVFADIDRIVAEALGEVPVNDDAQPAPPRPQPPGANTPPAESNTPPTQAPANDAAATRPRRGPARKGRVN